MHHTLQVSVLSYLLQAGTVASQFFLVSPDSHFCLSCTFIFRNERNWMKKSARVSKKLVSPGLPGLQVATRLASTLDTYFGKNTVYGPGYSASILG